MFIADPSKPLADVFMYTLHPTRLDMLTKGSTDAEKALAAQHWMHSIELLKKGVIMFAGRTVDTTAESHATVVFRAKSEEEARTIMNGDPAVKGGLFRARLFRYQPMLME
ncbi:MAG TPA: YciI family protein [Thermoanaerobaculia bacterium]